ncbi:MAG: glycosyltransferase family 39 protein [Planctomycetes bacterium]|nr:glycosyltransferase family 39 protein [Planctomycetota bacterium]
MQPPNQLQGGATKPGRLPGRIVLAMLLVQAGLLGYSAAQHSPTTLEPALLASGLSHLTYGRFEAYRVNPPLTRMIAAAPVLAVGYTPNWSGFDVDPRVRSEFTLGEGFLTSNQKRSVSLIVLARWACIPFSLLGAYFAYRWATELYGMASGFVTLTLYVFEPNLLAHGELITSDIACTSFGIVAGYTFWLWLKKPTWQRSICAGAALGLAQLAKMSWLILFVLWPLLWLAWRMLLSRRELHRKSHSGQQPSDSGQVNSRPSATNLAGIVLLGIYTINIGYGFDETGTSLGDFEFVSHSLNGQTSGIPGNRFRDTFVSSVPIPLPKQYVLGIDTQRRDFEDFGHKSYLRGEWRNHGWWYYYVYGLCVKVPCGVWSILGIVAVFRLTKQPSLNQLQDELILMAPALAMVILVSSQTEFTIHLRYVFPALGLFIVFLGQAGAYIAMQSRLWSALVLASLVWFIMSSMNAYPNQYAYFNEIVGGATNGRNHLLNSSLDWGQGLQEAITWIRDSGYAESVEFSVPSPTMAIILLDRSPNSSARIGERTVLYSADSYSLRQSTLTGEEKSRETVIKRFQSGMVLAVEQAVAEESGLP